MKWRKKLKKTKHDEILDSVLDEIEEKKLPQKKLPQTNLPQTNKTKTQPPTLSLNNQQPKKQEKKGSGMAIKPPKLNEKKVAIKKKE